MLILAGLVVILGQSPGAVNAEVEGLSPEAAAEYQRQYLSVEDVLAACDGSCSHRVVFTRGKYRQPLTEAQFLSALGRSEEVELRRTRGIWTGALLVGGLTCFAVGAALEVMPASDPGCGAVSDPGFSRCVQQRAANPPSPGFSSAFTIGFGASVAMFMAAALVYPGSLDAVEMRRLADQHNQALRRRLTGVQKEPRQIRLLGLSPHPTQDGLTLLLLGRF